MEEATGWLIPTSVFLLAFLFLSKFIIAKRQATHKNLPPSPPALPLIGHLHLIKEPLHQSLHKLTQKYGHMVFLYLGTRKVLVVSSPSAVEECLTRNDIAFANRPQTLVGKYLNYNNTTLGFSSYGDHCPLAQPTAVNNRGVVLCQSPCHVCESSRGRGATVGEATF